MTKRGWYKKKGLLLCSLLIVTAIICLQAGCTPRTTYASNVNATNVNLIGQDVTDDCTYVQFSIGWEYSWRDATNWDAVWIFVKYKESGGEWKHATMSATDTDHTVTNTNGVDATIDASNDGKGVFIYRNIPGTGSINWDGVKLRWNYGANGLSDDAQIQVKVFAIEMVYIPQGSFYVGDADSDQINCFHDGDDTGPYHVTSEGEITVGTGNGQLYYDQDNTYAGDRNSPIPAAYPKGYQALYTMKYEISQRQYAEFLNTLTATQATSRFNNFTVLRYYIEKVGDSYGCDANDNNILNEPDDGEWIACNMLSWMDGCAYADWAGLRPMTELEFEKICRGQQAVVNDEYAWGSSSITQATGISNTDTASEVSANAANAVYGSHGSVQGPLRCGALTDSDDNREESGASYYGAMEMSGNLWEKCVPVGTTQGRSFTGTHGDGTLSSGGCATNSDWPGYSGGEVSGYAGHGMRGGNWESTNSALRVADRVYACWAYDGRGGQHGFRLVRTASP